jgi:hypothetical protein
MENEWLKYLGRRNNRIVSIYVFSVILLYKDKRPGRSEPSFFRILYIYNYVHNYIQTREEVSFISFDSGLILHPETGK